eukprot:CAMPEP_0182568148 /NCGR_PEP_ID=MMETSP1324-20130603/9173_1 /TAXON_ID=236786 /ORGANISM="Florenciella sp., Strain RCC1587" /LENGTH=421 /DNA_ID=CAMNT_0024782265 /DNA_START=62 /DNA_END=1327 /DNA_ORIENTATION=+
MAMMSMAELVGVSVGYVASAALSFILLVVGAVTAAGKACVYGVHVGVAWLLPTAECTEAALGVLYRSACFAYEVASAWHVQTPLGILLAFTFLAIVGSLGGDQVELSLGFVTLFFYAAILAFVAILALGVTEKVCLCCEFVVSSAIDLVQRASYMLVGAAKGASDPFARHFGTPAADPFFRLFDTPAASPFARLFGKPAATAQGGSRALLVVAVVLVLVAACMLYVYSRRRHRRQEPEHGRVMERSLNRLHRHWREHTELQYDGQAAAALAAAPAAAAAAASVAFGSARGSADDPPSQFVCPITHELMADPCLTADGQCYSREGIEMWMKARSPATSPVTGLVLTSRTLTPNIALRQLIEQWREAHPKIYGAAGAAEEALRVEATGIGEAPGGRAVSASSRRALSGLVPADLLGGQGWRNR